MARGRIVSTSVAGDAALNRLSIKSALLYLQALPHLDRDGLITGHPMLLWALVAPLRSELMDEARALIDEWVQQGLAVRYEGADGDVLFFKGFRRHQANMPYKKESPSRFPPPPGWYRTEDGLLPEDPDLCRALAESFDRRSGYRKALVSAAAAASGMSPDEVATLSQRGRAEVKDQHGGGSGQNSHSQIGNTILLLDGHTSRPGSRPRLASAESDEEYERLGDGLAQLQAWCLAMIDVLFGTEWNAPESFVSDSLPSTNLERLAGWLWKFHSRPTEYSDFGPGYVIKMVRGGKMATLSKAEYAAMSVHIARFLDPAAILFDSEPAAASPSEASADELGY